MDACPVCGSLKFYTESGFYFCQECQTQQADKREDVVEYAVDTAIQAVKRKIRKVKLPEDQDDKSLGWTSWEAFNFILLGWTNELIMLGASDEFKITVLQLWATYLGKLEVAFKSFRLQSTPRLSIKYRPKDAEIIYGRKKKEALKKKTKRKLDSSLSGSDLESSHASDISIGRIVAAQKKYLIDAEYKKFLDTSESETDMDSSVAQSLYSVQSEASQAKKKKKRPLCFNNYARVKRKKIKESGKELSRRQMTDGPEHLRLPKLLGILNLALRLNDEDIFLSDMIRFQMEGHMSTKKVDHFFPDDEPIPDDMKDLYCGYSYDLLNKTSAGLAHFLEVCEIPEPNLMKLIQRYCTELQLPQGIVLYAERMIGLSQPRLTFEKRNRKRLLRYEARAISIIMMVMKILFGLDGVTEYEISTVVQSINSCPWWSLGH